MAAGHNSRIYLKWDDVKKTRGGGEKGEGDEEEIIWNPVRSLFQTS